ncbi:MAG: DUF167 family protein [Victivallaceae bacterium]|jgi:uncharacterized protein (TIGR00251 family)|nr:DUF167 family protein [Victivallaceae bacterium]NLK82542.1 YggU family protein [Lentisphaerota bacterium]MDD3117146.1 DUF167 family protein [Victivallaceae bacterium]MDD3702718.1 DUF167 family protein [Victivallaceae bacterium]MDD4317840.1 DUF167 family protein [Victivallaceae bacterium]
MNPEPLSTLLEENQHGVVIPCWIQPKSSRDSIVGIQGDAIKISITAPPVDGKANACLCKYLAKIAGVSKSSVRLISGQASRRKLFQIDNISKQQLLDKLLAHSR